MAGPNDNSGQSSNAGAGDIATQIKLGNQNMSGQFGLLVAALGGDTTALVTALGTQNTALIAAIAALAAVFPRVSSIAGGTFTCANSATTTVTQVLTQANSFILLMPTNAAAGTLIGSTKSLYVSARTANTSFDVSTASAVAAAGTETFLYVLINF